MKLVSFEGGFGRVQGGDIIPMGRDLVSFLAGAQVNEGKPFQAGMVPLTAPVPKPPKILAVGLNYRDHAAETGTPVPPEPVLFAKYANSVIGPDEPIRIPRVAEQTDYEAELGVVIGKSARRVSAAAALDVVAGYLCANDVSARDLQHHTSQWMRGKAIDSFLPCGPWLVTPDEVGDPQGLGIRCFVNGEKRQSSNTSQMIWGVAELISFISQTITLEPGDLLITGTPPGVGVARRPPVFLHSGDVVTVELDGLSSLSNPVEVESDQT